jgi:hypothetical protein
MTDPKHLNGNGGDPVLVAHSGTGKSPAMQAASAAHEAECHRVEGLRQKYAPDAEPWLPPGPNEPVCARPSWLMRAQAAESKVRDKALALEEAERIRRGKFDVTRGEFEDLLAVLGIHSESVDAARQAQARAAHHDRVNRRHPSEDAPTPEQRAAEERAMDERLAAHFEKLDKRTAEVAAVNEAAEQARRKH